MKQFLFILFLISPFYMKGQTWYTTYDCTTFDLGYRAEWIPPEACFTTVEYTYTWFKPRFNTTTQLWYNAATPEEEAEHQADLQAIYVPCEATTSVNIALITPQTDTQLNTRYLCQGSGFVLYCPNIQYGTFTGSGTAYHKIRTVVNNVVVYTWWKSIIFKNN